MTEKNGIIQSFMTDEMFAAVVKIFGPPRYFISMILIRIVFTWSHSFGQLKYLPEEDYRIWRSSMLSMLKEHYQTVCVIRVKPVVYAFALARIDVIRKTEDNDRTSPVVILCVKNDLKRIQMLVGHYRKLGIKRFAFLDNGSDDGTYEWLLEQRDTDLYRCFDKYRTAVKEGWINRIASYYGFDRWLILTDSDELVIYEGMETHSLEEVVRYGIMHGIKRFKGITLDTYARGKMFAKAENIQKEYCWIDSDSYHEVNRRLGKTVMKMYIGGPRYRLMHSDVPLSKFPLLYFEKGTVSDEAHFQYPHEGTANAPCHLGILHYKFIDTDLQEFEKRSGKRSGFYKGGVHYRQYLEFYRSDEERSLMYEGSIQFKDSGDLEKIEFIKPIHFE